MLLLQAVCDAAYSKYYFLVIGRRVLISMIFITVTKVMKYMQVRSQASRGSAAQHNIRPEPLLAAGKVAMR